LESVFKRDDAMEEIAREVVVALVVVERPARSVPVFVLVE